MNPSSIISVPAGVNKLTKEKLRDESIQIVENRLNYLSRKVKLIDLNQKIIEKPPSIGFDVVRVTSFFLTVLSISVFVLSIANLAKRNSSKSSTEIFSSLGYLSGSIGALSGSIFFASIYLAKDYIIRAHTQKIVTHKSEIINYFKAENSKYFEKEEKDIDKLVDLFKATCEMELSSEMVSLKDGKRYNLDDKSGKSPEHSESDKKVTEKYMKEISKLTDTIKTYIVAPTPLSLT